jgi:hypothetical protein
MTTHSHLFSLPLLLLALTCFTPGCSGDDTGGGGSGATGASGDTTSDTTSTTGSTSSGGVLDALVVNELSAVGEEWAELYNTGTEALDVGGYAVADKSVDGTPKLDEAMRFPAGTSIAAGEYVLVVGKFKSPAIGPQTECLAAGGPATCYQVSWGLSNANGDSLFLLTPGDEIMSEVVYPAGATGVGQTWGRLPNGTGNFAVNAPTPGGPNAAP